MKKTSFYIFLLLIIWTGIAGCTQKPGDDAIATDIKAKMFSDPELKTLPITLTVKNGEVTLTGEAPSPELQQRASRLAASATGVTNVVDLIKVQEAQIADREPARAQEASEAPPAAQAEVQPPPTTASIGRTREKAEKRVPVEKQEKAAPEPPQTADSVQTKQVESPKEADIPEAKRVEAERTAALPENVKPSLPKTVNMEIPAGHTLKIRMVDPIDSASNGAGEAFRATLEDPIVIDGKELVPEKTLVFIELVKAVSAGRMTGRSELELALHSMEISGKTYRLSSDTYQQVGKSRGKDTALKVGVATGIGTAIGAIAGGKKGAAIGAAVGGGSGVAVQAVTRGQQVKVPTETELEFRLKDPVTVPYTSEK